MWATSVNKHLAGVSLGGDQSRHEPNAAVHAVQEGASILPVVSVPIDAINEPVAQTLGPQHKIEDQSTRNES